MVVNDGSPTFSCPGARTSVLDPPIRSRRPFLVWLAEPDSCGSGHIAAQLKAFYSLSKWWRTHQITLWSEFRSSMVPSTSSTVNECITSALQQATHTITLPTSKPVRVVKYINIRAARHRAQQKAQQTAYLVVWITDNRISAVFPRHTNYLQRTQWHRFCTSLSTFPPAPKIWRVLLVLLGSPQQRNHFASLVIASDCCFKDIGKLFSRQFSVLVSAPPGIEE